MSEKKSWKRYAPGIIGGLLVTLVAVSLVMFVKNMLDKPVSTKKMVQQITLIQPPPPPPKLENPPEPEIKEEVEVPEPEITPEDMPDPMADDAPMGEDLALDAEGVAGGDSFGLLGRKGGRDLIGSGGHDPFAWYATSIQGDILDFLSEDADIRKLQYSIKVSLWLDTSGKIKRTKLLDSTGDRKMDERLKMALGRLEQLREKPPVGLPQPVNLLITSKI
ncbi:MAG: energy transducer TonB [Gammaproteobacteria bacterium]|nr:energy transducer TonB [Gammaproteobacteria bacterium]